MVLCWAMLKSPRRHPPSMLPQHLLQQMQTTIRRNHRPSDRTGHAQVGQKKTLVFLYCKLKDLEWKTVTQLKSHSLWKFYEEYFDLLVVSLRHGLKFPAVAKWGLESLNKVTSAFRAVSQSSCLVAYISSRKIREKVIAEKENWEKWKTIHIRKRSWIKVRRRLEIQGTIQGNLLVYIHSYEKICAERCRYFKISELVKYMFMPL